MARWINYKQLKTEIAFTDVLDHYNVRYKVKGNQAKGHCVLPGHEPDSKSKGLSVNLDRNVFQCFGCGAKGNVLDFVCLMEKLNPRDPKAFRKGAALAERAFLDVTDSCEATTVKSHSQSSGHSPRIVVNPPLDFELKGLDSEHAWFEEQGIDRQTVAHFQAGHCKRGYMKDHIAIPLYDQVSRLMGYIGHPLDEPREPDQPRYLFPKDRERNGVKYIFDASLLIYRALQPPEPADHLVLVPDVLTVWRVWQAGTPHVCGSITWAFSPEKAEAVARLLRPSGTLWVCAPHVEQGDRFATSVFHRIGPQRACRLVRYETSDDLLSTLRLFMERD